MTDYGGLFSSLVVFHKDLHKIIALRECVKKEDSINDPNSCDVWGGGGGGKEGGSWSTCMSESSLHPKQNSFVPQVP